MPQKKNKQKKKRLVLLDAHAILHRAYHALPEFTSHKGEPTGALYGLASMLIKLLNDLKPDYIVACYDMPGPTFRHEAYKEYKAQRPKTEDTLIHQINRSRDIFEVFSIPAYQKERFEADDILGTITRQLEKELSAGEIDIVIASGDMDTLQLVQDKRVQVYTPKKSLGETVIYDEKAVKDRFGFAPKLLVDYKGLRGDPSDNIPGVQGIGDKTATQLVQAFGTIEKIYKKLKKDPSAFMKKGFKQRVVDLLREGEEEALFSKTLASIRDDVPIAFSLPKEEWSKTFDIKKLEVLFYDLNFKTLLERAKKLVSPDANRPRGDTPGVVPAEEIEKTGIALWLLDSTLTNPTIEDILQFAHTTSFTKARDYISKELKARGLEKIYYEVELPLIPILKEAQKRGILVDVSCLKGLSRVYHKKLTGFQKRIWKMADIQFNIKSPKQLAEVLFDRLGLSVAGLRKTEGGARSTRESELQKLHGSHPIIAVLLAFREFQKLLSTYIDTIPEMVGKDGRLHTTLVQTGTTTGRMSSMNPNLQNIPIRGEYGREIRKAFVADKGYKLASFDYSQIEFRVLALLSEDEDLIRIFKEGKDVHSAVASEVFDVPEDKVTSDMRRRAKVINFGIVYGMGVTSLQKTLGSSRAEAQVFYDNYFSEFPGIRRYIEDVKNEAARRGYTETLFGRRRYFEGITSHISYIKNAALRMAINAPIQGTAADIIKLAMVKICKELEGSGALGKAHLLLQVHDELIYEIKETAVNQMTLRIKEIMENVIESRVPLEVTVSVGDNWGEMRKIRTPT